MFVWKIQNSQKFLFNSTNQAWKPLLTPLALVYPPKYKEFPLATAVFSPDSKDSLPMTLLLIIEPSAILIFESNTFANVCSKDYQHYQLVYLGLPLLLGYYYYLALPPLPSGKPKKRK